jgi:hypothetical protein
MAGPLASVERFFERLFERPAARLFQAQLEPVQIQRGLERAMESERVMRSRRAYAPSSYRVLVNAEDHAALDPNLGTLRSDLSESLRVYARTHGFTLLARPQVEIESSTVVPQGDLRVFATPPVVPDAPANGHDRSPNPTQPPASPGQGDDASADSDSVPLIPVNGATAVFAAPVSNAPSAVMAIRCPGQPVGRIAMRQGTVRLGRSLDNDVVLADDRVSRRHGQIGARHGMLVYTDLGSTNGSFLNSGRVTEIALGPGDVLLLGSSTVTIEPGA